MTFVNLQVRSCYSLLQSSIKITDLVNTAKQLGYDALALTDLNTMYGTVAFYRAAKAAKIKPIIGLTLQIAGLATDSEADFILLAKNDRGYHQLFQISSLKMTSTSLTWSQLAPYLHDLILIIPPTMGESAALLQADQATIDQWQQQKASLLAEVSVYLGISTRALSKETRQALQELAQKLALPLVALDDVRYLHEQDAFSNSVLQAIDAGKQLNDPLATSQLRGGHYLESAQASQKRYQDAQLKTAADHTAVIAAQCNVTLDFKRAQLPKFPVPQGQDAASYLKQLSQQGLAARCPGEIPNTYQKRLNRELKIIIEMGFADYFLIVWDVIKHAHQQKIMTGPGRGSAAGSLVAYVLGITAVDPLKYQLLFERFLNPERVTMPDIDLDFPDDRRDELIHYMHDRYGDQHMAQIITFGTMAAKQALRDVGRVFGLSQTQLSEWSHAVPSELNITLKKAYQQSEGLKNLIAADPVNKLLFKTALAIEGLPRHYSTHAAGIVLSAADLTATVPVQQGSDGLKLTQFPKGDVEALGLLKMDFLGLRNLSILTAILKAIPHQASFQLTQIPLDDPATLRLFQQGDTDGVFQFESSGIRQVLIKLKPTSFADIVATNALYRPGPMANIETFIARKNGRQKVTYPAPQLAPVLKDTYGVLVYQEQVMQVAVLMGGFTMAQADSLRRAVSKKKRADIDAVKTSFLQGAQQQGFEAQVAVTVFDYIEKFANYGFNKSHAVAYSLIAFWLAYLKVHYPAAFFIALLNANLNNDRKTAAYLQELRTQHVKISGPDINQSQANFSLDDQQQVRFGFDSIKGLRRDFIQQILQLRKHHGTFASLADFLKRLPPKFLKVDPLINLARVGCFDRFDQNRHQVVQNIRDLTESLQLAGNSVPLFDALAPKVTTVADYTNEQRLDFEKDLLGVYLSGHPLENYQQAMQTNHAQAISQLTTAAAGIIVYLRQVKVIRTKRGEQMAFIQAEDLSSSLELVAFPKIFRRFQEDLVAGKILYLQGQLETRPRQPQRPQFIIDQVEAVSSDHPAATLFLKLTARTHQAKIMKKLEEILLAHHGFSKVILYLADQKKSLQLEARFQVEIDEQLLTQLAELLGSENVVARS